MTSIVQVEEYLCAADEKWMRKDFPYMWSFHRSFPRDGVGDENYSFIVFFGEFIIIF